MTLIPIRVGIRLWVAALLGAGGLAAGTDYPGIAQGRPAARHPSLPARVVTTGTQDPTGPSAIPPPLALVGPVAIAPYKLAKWSLTGGKANVAWVVQPVELASIEPSGQAVVFTGPPGKYTILCLATVGTATGCQPLIFTGFCTIGESTPTPTPPTPTPEPTPPTPTPEPTPPPPIPVAGLRVLMVYESEDLSRYPPAQTYVLTSNNLRAYLNGACIKVGNVPEYRVWDKDIDTTYESALWQEAMKRPRGTLPTILISNGTTGYEGSLPATTAEAITLIQKYDPAINPPAARRKKAA